jgi:hypothetical protein
MKKTAFAITLASALMMSVAAFADTPPAEGTSCISGCDPLPNENWTYGSPVEVDGYSGSGVVVDVDTTVINMAELKSGGKASAKNQSNFRTEVITTTTIEYEVTVTEQSKINPGGQDKTAQQGGPLTNETVEYLSENSETEYGEREHVHPHE